KCSGKKFFPRSTWRVRRSVGRSPLKWRSKRIMRDSGWAKCRSSRSIVCMAVNQTFASARGSKSTRAGFFGELAEIGMHHGAQLPCEFQDFIAALNVTILELLADCSDDFSKWRIRQRHPRLLENIISSPEARDLSEWHW